MKKRTMLTLFLSLLWMAPLLQGGACVENLTRDQMVTMLVKPAFGTFLQETDLGVAWQSIGGQLKLIEIMMAKDSNVARKDKFQMLLCQGFTSYALLMEPQLGRLQHAAQNVDKAEKKKVLDAQVARLQKRMRLLSLRGRAHCFEILERRYKGFTQAATLGKPRYKEILKKANKDDVATMFWGGFGWGYALINGLEDTNLVSQIPQLKQLMHRIVELDPKYFFGGGHIFLATFYAQSQTLGGDLKKAKFHFDKAYELSEKSALIVHYFQARFYTQQKNDTDGCKKLLKHIGSATINNRPMLNLMNAWSKEMGRVAMLDSDEFCP